MAAYIDLIYTPYINMYMYTCDCILCLWPHNNHADNVRQRVDRAGIHTHLFIYVFVYLL